VCSEVGDPGTWEREVRALLSAAAEHPEAVPILLTFDALPPLGPLPPSVRWLPASTWLLGADPV
jgi:hypothetical protein